ncbi:MAG: hypothetical protein WCL30_01390 [Pseudomonadota bacterium]
MVRILPYILLVGIIYGVLFFTQKYQPEAMNKFLISIDIIGASEAAKQENYRLSQIRNLRLTYPEKQVLVNRTVFIGATKEMVKLSLGDPKKEIWKNDKLYYVYYLPNDSKPTLLVFDYEKTSDTYKLSNAYKTSALYISNSDVDQKE